ncbi:MAG: hypothetical protein LUD51_04050 [Clostridia bacterium]|nr:hypothetical protein [Clostridia bacterium]
MKKDHSKRNELILLIVSNVLVAALFIADWGRHGFESNENNWLPGTNLFVAWIIFLVPSVIQLVCILKKWPVGTIIVSALKTIIYGLCCGVVSALGGYKSGIEITGLKTLFEAYGNIIMPLVALAVGVLFFILDIIFCVLQMRRRNGRKPAHARHSGYSGAEKAWLASGVIAVLLWFFIAMSYYLSSGGWEKAIIPAIVFIAAGMAWWFASRHSRAGSVVMFIIQTILAVLSLDTVYWFYIYTGPVYAFLPVLQIAALIVWYVFTCILLKRRWRESGRSV